MILVVTFSAQVVCGQNNEKENLLELSDEECLKVLVENGLEIPNEYSEYSDVSGFVKKIVENVIETPMRTSWYNYKPAQEFAEQIREVVLKYENSNDNFLFSGITTFSNYTLVDSSTYGNWSNSYWNYNCYAYAVGKTSWINPGETIGVDYSNNASTLETMTATRLASLVTYDLQKWGYSNITYSTTLPTYENGYRVIAVRKCKEDYHFMRMITTGVWHHKPSCTWLLKYKYSSVNSIKWNNECAIIDNQGNRIEYSPNIYYDSEVYYIKYKLR